MRSAEEQFEELKKQWDELKATILLIELDVIKSMKGNVSAGVRAKRGLRNVRKLTHQFLLNLQTAHTALTRARRAARRAEVPKLLEDESQS